MSVRYKKNRCRECGIRQVGQNPQHGMDCSKHPRHKEIKPAQAVYELQPGGLTTQYKKMEELNNGTSTKNTIRSA